jgi:hypothetical protein
MPPDTLLPGSMTRPDNLLPHATRSTPVQRPVPTPVHAGTRMRTRVAAFAKAQRRHLLAIVIVGVALTMSLIAAWPVVFGGDTPSAATSAADQARATGVLRTVVGGGRTLFAPRHSFAQVSPSALSARSHDVPVVAATARARTGEVSMRVTSPGVLTLATPADTKRCVFARDEPATSGTQFVTIPTADCRAASAPAQGWSPR